MHLLADTFIVLKKSSQTTCLDSYKSDKYLSLVTQWLHLSVLSSALEAFVAQNHSLDYLRGTLGYSYMCRERQTLGVTPDLAINTFQVHVQPFGVTGMQFAAGKFLFDEQKMIK